jgi:hypothetical protein
MDLIFSLLILAFFGCSEFLVLHPELCRTVSGMYWKFITCYDMFKKNFVIFYAFQKVQTHIPSDFLLFTGEVFWNQLCTNFLHAKFLSQNVMDGLVIKIQLTTDLSDYQMFIRPHKALTLVTFSCIYYVQGLPE